MIYSCKIKDMDKIPDELLDKEFKRESIVRLKDEEYIKPNRYQYMSKPFALVLYLDAPDRIEPGISARAQYI